MGQLRAGRSSPPAPTSSLIVPGSGTAVQNLTDMSNEKRANDARSAGIELSAFWQLQGGTFFGLLELPAEIVQKASAHVDRLDKAMGGKKPATSQLRGQVQDLLEIARYLDTESRADHLMYRELQFLDRNRSVLAFLSKCVVHLGQEVAKSVRRMAGTRRIKQGRNAEAPDDIGRPVDLERIAEQGRKLERLREILPERHPDLDEQEPASWQQTTTKSRGGYSAQDFAAVCAFFHRGTFRSRWASARHHFQKHAASQPGACLVAYIARAVAARSLWPEALRAGTGRLEWNRSSANERVRVISNAEVWLAMTDQENPKSISFRERRWCPYR